MFSSKPMICLSARDILVTRLAGWNEQMVCSIDPVNITHTFIGDLEKRGKSTKDDS